MESDKELREAVQQLADEEGISFKDALDIAVKTLRYETQRRKSFLNPACSGGYQACGNTHDQLAACVTKT